MRGQTVMSNKKGRLFIISAPSGTGKSTVINYMISKHENLVLSVSATTRAPRAGEVNGVAYYFVTREDFTAMVERGEFLEHAEYIGEFYGTPKQPIYECIDSGKDILLEIEVQGARQVMEKERDAVSIFIVPPDMDELERRLRGRGTDTEEKLAARLVRAAREMEEKDRYSHIVVNDTVERAAKEIMAIIDNTGKE